MIDHIRDGVALIDHIRDGLAFDRSPFLRDGVAFDRSPFLRDGVAFDSGYSTFLKMLKVAFHLELLFVL